ncbi:MAG: electron transfer flavoprotein-ubiquinone oxidoreductase [Rhodobacteraceae bacterium]|nr:electron transfer flavoprotein-ubiquinone oxidoreductase [Paracoccaceae bacterium]
MSDIQREAMEFDVVIVGAGPAGLSAAIRLKQLNPDLEVCLLEKGAEIGSHILSGAILDPIGLNTLIPDWQSRNAPVKVPVKKDNFYILGEGGQIRIPNWPMPPLMNNHGNYIVSMANVCRWLAEQAEEMEIEVYPSMACSELVYGPKGEVKGVIAGEFGKNSDGTAGPNYEPGFEVNGKFVFLCEGARGSLSKTVIEKFQLDKDSDYPKFGIGMKEIWEIDPEKHQLGTVTHTAGWPLSRNAGGGSFIYHGQDNQISLGFVVHLNYANPYLFPYMEFQRFKHHPMISDLLEGGRRIAFGARAITEGGWQSIPKVTFPGGVLVGCAAGLVNVPRIKGNHNAMLSGIAAADAASLAIKEGKQGIELTDYESSIRNGPVGQDLKPVKNVKPLWTRYGLTASFLGGFVDMWSAALFNGSPLGTLKHGKSDSESMEPMAKHKPIDYPKPDGVISFDRLTNVSYTGTNHEAKQPCHLHLKNPDIPIQKNLPTFAEPAQRYCPVGVYEVIENTQGQREFKINFQNCIHCKTCDIKDPSQNITWNTPQGGDGPNYPNM